MRARLGACKTGFLKHPPPPVILYYRAFQGDTSVVVLIVLIVLCFGVEFVCCLSLMYVLIFLVSSGNRVAAYWGIAAHSAYDMFSLYKYLSVI